MAVFPELIPSTRTYSPGAYPHTTHRVYNGSEARVRHSNTVLGVRLRLFFPAITTADLLLVIAHYNGQQGRFLPFAIPDELLSGTSTPADFTPVGHQWRYAAKPSVEDISVSGDTPSNVHNLTVELETVPPENTIVQGARLRVLATLQAGSPQRGAALDVFTTLAAGPAAAQVDFTATATLEPGSPFPVVSFDVVATLEAGEFIPQAEGLVATATLAAGVAGNGVDPDFASVSLLLPLNGTNGSTTFTDVSPNALTVTGSADAQISTAQSKWNGSSLYLDGTLDELTVPSNVDFDFGTGAFTVEAWVYLLSTAGDWFITSASGTGGMFFGYANSQSPPGWGCGRVGVAWDVKTGITTTTGAWQHIAICRSGTNLRFFVDGVQAGTTATNSQSYNLSTTDLRIGGQGASRITAYLQDVRVTKGVARYTADFTAPVAPLPTA